ncbi:hypothetical protein KKB83_03140 [Patescibacteria group bacterium]|nr:hypothetical protein [Patescibacteria group bacterium]
MKTIVGLASTTHLDLDGDKMSKRALISMANQINNHYSSLDIEHLGIYIGVMLAAKVKKLNDGEFGLSVVAGIFDSERECGKYPYKGENTVSKAYMHLLSED